MPYHSMLPWAAGRPNRTTGVVPIVSTDGIVVAHVTSPQWGYDDSPRTPPEADGNTALIVRAVNTHAQLIDALRLAARHVPLDAMEYSKGTHGDRIYPADVIRAALAAAEAPR